jgi:hypothetical protein
MMVSCKFDKIFNVCLINIRQTLEMDEELCSCFIDWQKSFDHVKWMKLMQILKEAGIDWHERRLVRKLYMDQIVIVQLDQEETKCVLTGRGIRQRYCLSLILFNIHNKYFIREAERVWRLQNWKTNNSHCVICR